MMKPSLLLTLAAIYLAIGGLGLLLAPEATTMGIVAAGSSGALTALIRGYGGTLIGIAVIDALVRNEAGSKGRDAIFLGNTVGFGLVAITDVIGQLSGGPQAGLVFAVLDVLFTLGFLFVGKANMSKS